MSELIIMVLQKKTHEIWLTCQWSDPLNCVIQQSQRIKTTGKVKSTVYIGTLTNMWYYIPRPAVLSDLRRVFNTCGLLLQICVYSVCVPLPKVDIIHKHARTFDRYEQVTFNYIELTIL